MARILVIDDEQPLRKAIREILESQGYEVGEAGSGEAGLKSFLFSPAEIVITDIIMENKSGYEFIRDIIRSNKAVKVVAISGGGAIDKKNILDSATRIGAHRGLEKPFSAKELLDTINDLVEEIELESYQNSE